MASNIDPDKPAPGVPVAKLDIRANFAAAKAEIEALQATKIEDGAPFDMRDAVLTRPEIRDYAETSPTASVGADGVLTLDLEAGNVVEVTLIANVTTLTLTNPPAPGRAGAVTLILRQDATGGRTVGWPASVKWPGGTAPTASVAAGAIDIYTLVTRDGGATWYGMTAGQGFA